MMKQSLAFTLGTKRYPGRGIILGRNQNGDVLCAYFIMGRSANSRNRIFAATDENTIETRAFDESRMEDPSLIIYAPIRRLPGKRWIITNGDQTDTIRDALLTGKSFEDALRTRTFEPDAPNWTPRISALVTEKDGSPVFQLSILKSFNGDPSCTQRAFFDVENPPCSTGFYLHTYQDDGHPLPSFQGEPEEVIVEGDLDPWTMDIWDHLDRDNRISLFTCRLDMQSGDWKTRIINQYEA